MLKSDDPAIGQRTSSPVHRLSDQEFLLFQSYLERECGLRVAVEQKCWLESHLGKLLQEQQKQSFSELYRALMATRNLALRDRVVESLTSHETQWFRDGALWAGLRDQVLPELASQANRSGRSQARIWCAGCSTGQEPYSLAMLIDQFCRGNPGLGVSPARFEILATDLSPSALFVASAGHYDAIAMSRGFGSEWQSLRALYFTRQGAISAIDPGIKQRVTFKRANLQDPFGPLGNFDLLLMRYVVMHFSSAFQRDLSARIAAVVRPGGYLWLGATEALLDEPANFGLERHGMNYLYRRSATGKRG